VIDLKQGSAVTLHMWRPDSPDRVETGIATVVHKDGTCDVTWQMGCEERVVILRKGDSKPDQKSYCVPFEEQESAPVEDEPAPEPVEEQEAETQVDTLE